MGGRGFQLGARMILASHNGFVSMRAGNGVNHGVMVEMGLPLWSHKTEV